MPKRTKPLMNPHRPDEPAIRQPPCAGWAISYDPEARAWHVAFPDSDGPEACRSIRIFSERRNALAWARRHPLHDAEGMLRDIDT